MSIFSKLFRKKEDVKYIQSVEDLGKPQDEALWNQIQNTPIGGDNQEFLVKLKEETEWSTAKCNLMIGEYRKFLYLAAKKDSVVPSKDVDEVWHTHILFTHDYLNVWPKVLGKTLHHNPDTKKSKSSKKELNNGYSDTVSSYRSEFGSPPDDSGWLIPMMILNSCSSSSPAAETPSHSSHSHSHHSDSSPSHSCSSHSHASCSSHSSCSSSSASSCSSGSSCSGGSSCGGSSCGGS